jgi:predicted metal-binding membrane protein
MASERASQQAFLGVSALLFAASAAVTIVWCASMSAMGGMPMPGGWTMSMAWMRMPGQTWTGAAASFLGMWVVMMVAMMLPSLVPMLWRYRQAVGRTGGRRLGRLTALVAVSYFFVWTVFGTGRARSGTDGVGRARLRRATTGDMDKNNEGDVERPKMVFVALQIFHTVLPARS